jgi:hypothetical protein
MAAGLPDAVRPHRKISGCRTRGGEARDCGRQHLGGLCPRGGALRLEAPAREEPLRQPPATAACTAAAAYESIRLALWKVSALLPVSLSARASSTVIFSRVTVSFGPELVALRPRTRPA